MSTPPPENQTFEVTTQNKVSYKNIVDNKMVAIKLATNIKNQVLEWRNEMGYTINDDEYIKKNIRLWGVKYKPDLATSCEKHAFCYGNGGETLDC